MLRKATAKSSLRLRTLSRDNALREIYSVVEIRADHFTTRSMIPRVPERALVLPAQENVAKCDAGFFQEKPNRPNSPIDRVLTGAAGAGKLVVGVGAKAPGKK